MSRNLGTTMCDRCGHDVLLDESPRAPRPEELGSYIRDYGDRQFANASCPTCGALYLAWFSQGGGTAGDRFKDLSYRSTFNDEPGPTDLPPWPNASTSPPDPPRRPFGPHMRQSLTLVAVHLGHEAAAIQSAGHIEAAAEHRRAAELVRALLVRGVADVPFAVDVASVTRAPEGGERG